MNHRNPSSLSSGRPAFTLVELMISVALVLLLVIGINQVFSLTSKTVGTGQASSAVQRDMRAAQRVMADDFANALTTNGPFFMIYSRQVYAFRNKADQQSDRDGLANTQDVQNLGSTPEPPVPVPITSNRSHRVDMIRFFARGDFHRQTGDVNTLISPTSSGEAMITLGHGQLPDNNGAYSNNTMPGAGNQQTNPNNFYASQWVLTREAMLLTPSIATTAYRRGNASPPNLSPLRQGTLASPNTGPSATIESSRFDIAETSIDGIGSDLAARLRAGSSLNPNVWYRVLPSTDSAFLAWSTVYPTATQSDLLYRMRCNPFITKPLTPSVAALTSPYFVGGCSQFIVEFAGDFVAQDNETKHTDPPVAPVTTVYGQVVGNHPDGVLDFYIAPGTATTPPTRQIRWYGMPRDVDGSGKVQAAFRTPTGGGAFTVSDNNANHLYNVVPVRDVLASGNFPPADFEKEVSPTSTRVPNQTPGFVYPGIPELSGPVTTNNYEGTPTTGDYADSLGNTQMPKDCSYLCIWNYGGPQMIRITVTVEDPNGRLPDGVTFEYVFTLKK